MIIAMILTLLFILIIFAAFIWQAVWVAIDSRKKGEEYWWLWTIAAIIAFPIGLIVYALVTRSDKSKCNNCGKEIPHNINSCPYCGMKCGFFCPSCGQKVESGWNYCPHCTTELPDEIKESKASKKSNKKVMIAIVITITILALLIVISFLGVITYSFNGEVFSSSKNEIVTSNDADERGYIGSDYEVEYTDIRTYNLRAGIRSVDYSGTRKNGEVIIRLYDSQGNLLSESEPINSKKFNDVFASDNGYATKIEIEYINFKGSFYFHF